MPFAPARKLLDAGACLAIATDHNPGSAWSDHFLLPMQFMANQQKLTCAEVLAGITFRACAALEGLPKLERWEAGDQHPEEWRYGGPFGRIAPGYLANFNVSRLNHEEIVYHAPMDFEDIFVLGISATDSLTNDDDDLPW